MTLQVNDVSDEFDLSGNKPDAAVRVMRTGLYRNGLKRVLDLTLVLLTAGLAVPLVAFLALLVALDGSAPFYFSPRVGRSGREFRMLKLRTMVPDAERRLEQYLSRNAEARLEWNSTQKLKDDPRITWIGRILRKTSLDELPQLWNVVLGQMSLVGPRPFMPSQRVLYDGTAYYTLRPGVTGPWQVSARNETTFAKRSDFDRLYDETLSLQTDVKILLATVRVVLKGTGY
ncbi:sugar transferase [Defluviimonas salinarum]|uniref:Sugar transferase n=1 Tax=Defluviimonas salinarum TaxID=2992147 RepID=A0ABT3J7Y3_9RHOB|nr:sugar transferase [Defluviimonas salinarum]MCW3783801.1 sugar transferase [Defluviimonas salinarum]